MSDRERKLVEICDSVDADYRAVLRVLNEIAETAYNGGIVITHSLGTFFRREISPRKRTLNGVEHASHGQYKIGVRQRKGRPAEIDSVETVSGVDAVFISQLGVLSFGGGLRADGVHQYVIVASENEFLNITASGWVPGRAVPTNSNNRTSQLVDIAVSRRSINQDDDYVTTVSVGSRSESATGRRSALVELDNIEFLDGSSLAITISLLNFNQVTVQLNQRT